MALLSKLGWILASSKHAFWADYLRARYCGKKYFWSVEAPADASIV